MNENLTVSSLPAAQPRNASVAQGVRVHRTRNHSPRHFLGIPLIDLSSNRARNRTLLLTCGLVSALSALVAIAQVPGNAPRALPQLPVRTSPEALVAPQSSSPAQPVPRMQDLMAIVNHAPDAPPHSPRAKNAASTEALAVNAADRTAPVDSARTASTELLRDTPNTSNAPQRQAPAVRSRVVWFEVTAYCPCTKCCGEDAAGVTASGKPISYNRGRFVAADTDVLPFGSKISIPGYHDARTVEVIDRGSAIKGHRLDVYFPSHSTAKTFGRRWVPVTIYEK